MNRPFPIPNNSNIKPAQHQNLSKIYLLLFLITLRTFSVQSESDSVNLPISFTAIQTTASSVTLNWTGGNGPFAVQQRTDLTESWCTILPMTTIRSAQVLPSAMMSIYRVVDFAAISPVSSFVSLNMIDESSNAALANGSGSGTVQLEGNTVTFKIDFSSLSSPAVAAHLHGLGTHAESTNNILDLSRFIVAVSKGQEDNHGQPSTVSGQLSGTVMLTLDQKAAFLSGQTYVDIHTQTHDGGELRGEVRPILAGIVPCVVSPSVRDIRISFRLDPWLVTGNYSGGLWSSPAVLGPAVQTGPIFVVEARASGLDHGKLIDVIPTWTSANSDLVTVSPSHGHQVKITVHRAGQTSIDIVSQSVRQTLLIKAEEYLGNGLLVEISQE